MAGQHGEGTPVSKLHIESVQTITPFKETDPRQRRQVLVTDPVGSGVFRRCFNILLYYKKLVEDESGWIVAGWMKESIARALVHQPLLGGRLRRGEDGHAGLEIVSNDSGLRLIEASIPMTLSEFLDKESRDDEAELVFWKDIDEQNPQFSPLIYVQVTNFECGGYSIGMSCNILLADLLITEKFLKKWVNIHNEMLSKADDAIETPIFYFPTLKKTSGSPSIPIIISDQTKNCGKTMIFKIDDENVNLENESGKTLMLVCVKETENELGSKLASKFPVFLKEPSNTIKIETYSRLENEMVLRELDLRSQVRGESWDDLGANEIVHKGNKPTCVSYWMGSVMDGLVMALTSPEGEEVNSGSNIIVSVPRN